MEHQSKQRISGEVFSAKAYFEQCARGSTHPDGNLSFTEEIPERGVWRPATDQRSLIWIDGIYGDSLAQERFFASLRSGEVPAPISGTTSRTVNQRTAHTSPVALVASAQTILSACGHIDAVVSAALLTPHTRCAGCNALLSRYHSPLSMLEAIARDRDGRAVLLYAESSDSRLAEWATSRGLRIEPGSQDYTSVYLDRADTGTTTNTSVAGLVHSLWRIPNIRLATYESTPDKPTRRYTPSGWCNRCGTSANQARPAKLRELLEYGLRGSNEKAPEALLSLTPTLTIRELLLTPLQALEPLVDIPLKKTCEYFAKLAFNTCSLGDTTNTLDARDLAKVSIIASILTSTGHKSRIIIDLPHNIIEYSDAVAVTQLLEHHETESSIAVVRDPFSAKPRHSDQIEIKKGGGPLLITLSLPQRLTNPGFTQEIHGGDLLRIVKPNYHSHKLFHELTEQLTTTVAKSGAPMIVSPIPVFNAFTKSVSVLGEELGLLEPLTQLYAASLDARVHGLTTKDFTLFRTRSPRYTCQTCYGLGVVLSLYKTLPRPLAAPCPVCCGARCKPPVSTALFRGVSFSTILNQPIAQSAQTLTALSKAKAILDMVISLDLHHLPLGMPVALLSASELRRLLVVRALRQARRSKPALILFETPTAGLSELHQEQLARIQEASLADRSATWIELL